MVMSKSKKTVITKVNKDAGTGKFVSNEYLEKHPKTTFKETVRKKVTKKKK